MFPSAAQAPIQKRPFFPNGGKTSQDELLLNPYTSLHLSGTWALMASFAQGQNGTKVLGCAYMLWQIEPEYRHDTALVYPVNI